MNLLKRVDASLQARCVQPWQQKHFDRTKWGKRIASYRNAYRGKRCFLIGNGPSLCAEDLTVLHEHGEVAFGFNRVYNIFDQTPWRPTFYISQDEKMLKGSREEVNQLKLPCIFVPIQLKWYHNIQIDNALYFNMNWQTDENLGHLPFSDHVEKELFCANTGMYTAAQLAAYMGFTELYMIGVDHHFRISQDMKGEVIVDDSAKDYFTEKYNHDKDQLYIPNTEKSTLTYQLMKKHCDSRGITVYNATRGGRLEVFRRVAFDKLF